MNKLYDIAKDIEVVDSILRIYTWRSVKVQNAIFGGISDLNGQLILSQYNE